jgi:hypothetical protein
MVSWACPSAPASDTTMSILSKWEEQQRFVRFVDGDVMNSAVSNLEFVSLREALSHVEDCAWKVDWDAELTCEERALVLTPEWRACLVFD